MLSVAPKSVLIRALCSYAESRTKNRTQRFLEGLSRDELHYIAEFLGSCILQKTRSGVNDGDHVVEAIRGFENQAGQAMSGTSSQGQLTNREHKMILLYEYLSRKSSARASSSSSAGRV